MNQVIFKENIGKNGKKIAEIILNSERYLNALTLEMVNQIEEQLEKWTNSDVLAVILDGAGDKAFCAGGDVVSVRENIKNRGPEYAETFFAREFILDYNMHNYKKPIICWGSGIVMGGGMGLMNGCNFRVVTETSRLAMPETAIGYYPDVGGSYFLNKVPKPFGLFLGVSGSPINGIDAIDLNLADFFLANSQKGRLIDRLCSADLGNQKTEIIVQNILSDLQFESKAVKKEQNGKIKLHADFIRSAMNQNSLSEAFDIILSARIKDIWFEKMQNSLSYGSPLSALIVEKQLIVSEKMPLWDIFKLEMILTGQFVRNREFPEGVRAKLVDKDNKPKWTFKTIEQVDFGIVDSFFRPPWEVNPLDKLIAI